MKFKTRKPNAVPPGRRIIQKFGMGGKVRQEDMQERLERLLYEYEDGPKPKHYDDPNIIDHENFKQRPVPFNNNDSSTFPSNRNQRQRMNTWDLMLETAKGNPKEMKEIRKATQQLVKIIGDGKTTINLDGRVLAESTGLNMYDIAQGM